MTAPTRPAIIGRRRDGRPIFAIMGASAPATEQPPAGTDPAGQAPPPAAPPATPPAPGSADELVAQITADPAKAAETIRQLRAAEGKARTSAKASAAEEARAAVLAEFAQKLGLAPGEKATPEQLTAQLAERDQHLTQAQEQAKAARLELAVYRVASAAGADPVALSDSRRFLESVRTLDPDADDFTAKLTEAAKAAVVENATLRAAVGRAGVDLTRGTGENGAANVQPGVDRLRYAYESGR